MSYADPVDEQQHFSKGSTPLLQRRTYGTVGSEPATRNSGLRRPPEIDIVWKNISYKVPEGKNGPLKTVINNVSGEARCGQLCAFMGSSGAGKTTLLDVLASRVEHPENVDGVIELNNVPLDRAILRKVSSYVIQEERLPEAFTVHETFTFYASLRLPKSMSVYEKSQIVDELIEQLSLTKARDTPIGGYFFQGLQKGEKRRVSIGIELVTRPGLIFLDEPTTGLDSNSSHMIVQCLKNFAADGRTILLSLNSPSIDSFYLLDSVLLLSEGETFYFGPIDRCKEYFSGIGFHCPEKSNPAGFILGISNPAGGICLPKKSPTIEEARRFRQKYPDTSIGIEMFSKLNTPSHLSPIDISKLAQDSDRISTFDQVKLLIWRSVIGFRRNPIELASRFCVAIALAILGGIVFYNQSESDKGTRGRMSTSLYSILGPLIISIIELMQIIPGEKDLFVRDRRNRVYDVHSYLMSRFITDRIPVIAAALVFCPIVYYMVGLRSGAEHFFKYFLIVFVNYNSSQSLSLFLGSLVKNAIMGAIFGPIFGALFILFTGYVIIQDRMADSVSWILEISITRWGVQALVVNEFDGFVFDNPPLCSYRTGENVLEIYAYDGYDYGECALYVIIGFLATTVLAYTSFVIQDLRIKRYG